jgi:hypothetical protein
MTGEQATLVAQRAEAGRLPRCRARPRWRGLSPGHLAQPCLRRPPSLCPGRNAVVSVHDRPPRPAAARRTPRALPAPARLRYPVRILFAHSPRYSYAATPRQPAKRDSAVAGDGQPPWIREMRFPSQCSWSGFIGVAGRSVSPGTIEALADEAGGPYALVGRWGRWVLSAGRGLGDE